MKLELSDQERRALHRGAVLDAADAHTQETLVILRREEYERLLSVPELTPLPAPQSDIPVGIRRAQEAYWRDLPELLKLRSPERCWVAYHNDERLGFGGTMAALYQQCAVQRIPTNEVYVDRLSPRSLPPWEEEEIEAHFESDDPSPVPEP